MLTDLQWLLKDSPDEANYRYSMGYALMRPQRPQEAIGHLRAALALPDAPEGTDSLLYSLLVAVRESVAGDEAGRCTAQLVQQTPEEVNAWGWRFEHLWAAGDDTGALAALERVKQLADPDDKELASFIEHASAALAKPD